MTLHSDPIGARPWAPIAHVVDLVPTVEERHDADLRTFYCYQNYYEREDLELHDVTLFAEPESSSVGGDALVRGWQFNGRKWEQTFSFIVESVDNASNSVTYKPGSMVGKWWDASPTILILANADDQPAGSWTLSTFAVIGR